MDAFNEHFVIALSAAGQSSSRWGHTHTSADTTTTLSLICIYVYLFPPSSPFSSFFLLGDDCSFSYEKRRNGKKRRSWAAKVTHQNEDEWEIKIYKKKEDRIDRICWFLHDHIYFPPNDCVDLDVVFFLASRIWLIEQFTYTSSSLSLTWFFKSSVWEMSVYLFLHPSLVGRRRRRRRRTSFWNILKFLGNRKRERDKSSPGCVVYMRPSSWTANRTELGGDRREEWDRMICNVKKKRVGWMASVIRQCLSAVSWVWAPCNGRRYVRRGRWIRCCLSSKGIAKEKNQKTKTRKEDNKLMP